MKKRRPGSGFRRWMCITALCAVTAVSATDSIDGKAAVLKHTAASQANLPETPTEPSSGPQIPTEPSIPETPTEPSSGPQIPTEPSIPETPTEPMIEPSAPTGPTEPTKPLEPEKPIEPVRATVGLYQNKKNPIIKWKKQQRAASYAIYRSSKKNGKYRIIATVGKKKSKYTDKSVERGNYYYYRVAANLKGGKSSQSDKLSFACPIKPATGIKLIRYSTSSIKVTWKQNRQAYYYKVYVSKQQSGNYRRVGTTAKTWFRVKQLDNNQTYYFRVKACIEKKSSKLDSPKSTPASMTTQSYERTTVFAGDSITTGLTSYGALNNIDIGGYKNVVAAIGLNTTTFRTRRVFGGLSALGSIIAQKPYRVYIMLGTNEIHYRSSRDVVAGYREIVQELKRGAPDTDVVLLAVPPVTSAKQLQSRGFMQIPELNQNIQTMAGELGVRYYDYTLVLKDANGCLQRQYAAGDGIHWTSAAYRLFAAQIAQYDKSLD